jgi:hypothetical protein
MKPSGKPEREGKANFSASQICLREKLLDALLGTRYSGIVKFIIHEVQAKSE